MKTDLVDKLKSIDLGLTGPIAYDWINEAIQEIIRLRNRESAYLWDKYPDRMGGAFTQDEIDNANTWK